MSDRERIHREDSPRTGPNRNWPNRSWFGSVDRTTPAAGENGGPGGATEDWQSAVEQGVRLGYEVIDAQIREGRRVAEQINGQFYGVSAPDGARDLTDRYFRTYTDLAARWLDLMSAMTNGATAQNGQNGSTANGAPQTDGTRAETGTAEAGPVAIEVDSQRPIKVTLDLHPGATSLRLGSQPLCHPDSDKPPLRDVLFEPAEEGEPMTLRLRVPDNQPEGIYSAVVFDRREGKPRGTVSVAISSTAAAQHAA